MADSQRFADLGRPRRVWAVAAIHADIDRLAAAHAELVLRFRVGDRLVYLGNLVGYGAAAATTLDALLTFRRRLLAAPGVRAEDVVYLRGRQEEMWRKLLQLHFAPNPAEVLDWMLGQGVGPTLAAYGGVPEHGFAACRGGAVALSRWTQGLRAAFYAHPGHESLFNALKRAAYVGAPGDPDLSGGLLFVHAGVDLSAPFDRQNDSFWWGAPGFAGLDRPFCGFSRIVRGFDPQRGGAQVGDYAVTLDAGCGAGGPLVCAAFTADGDLADSFQI